MEKLVMLLMTCFTVAATVCFASLSNAAAKQHPVVLIETNLGNITLELDADKAPITVKNFLDYVNSGHYNGTIFHRVINGFMIQGGGFTKEMNQKATKDPIVNEAENGLKNDRGTIAMARTSDVNSATSQFFINVVDNKMLDYTSKTPAGYGYCVFGKVTKGMDVIDKIKEVKTATKQGHGNVPLETIEIIKISVVS
jgi:cyclophilin family peptidyl-prolyl cis-trans isomerase